MGCRACKAYNVLLCDCYAVVCYTMQSLIANCVPQVRRVLGFLGMEEEEEEVKMLIDDTHARGDENDIDGCREDDGEDAI